MADPDQRLKCPKCGHINTLSSRSLNICVQCGFDLDTYHFHREKREEITEVVAHEPSESGFWHYVTSVESEEAKRFFYLRIAIYIAMVAWGLQFMKMGYGVDQQGIPPVSHSFLHLINLPIHETGHIVFRPFGDFMMFLGGSLFQLLVPFGIMLFFVIKTRDNFAAAIGLWWTAQSLKDVVPYINDARALDMMLLTGPAYLVPQTHDWRNILAQLGALQHDTAIASAANSVANLLFMIAFVWGAVVLWKLYGSRRKTA